MSRGLDLFVDDDELLERFGRIRPERNLNMTPEQRYDRYIQKNQWDIEDERETRERLEELRELKSEHDYEMRKDETNLYPGEE